MVSENHEEGGKKESCPVINIGNSPEKWLDLMLYLKNATPTTFCLKFSDAKTASNAARRMSHQTEKYYSWFPMVIARREANVYVIKHGFAKKMVVIDEPKKEE